MNIRKSRLGGHSRQRCLDHERSLIQGMPPMCASCVPSFDIGYASYRRGFLYITTILYSTTIVKPPSLFPWWSAALALCRCVSLFFTSVQTHTQFKLLRNERDVSILDLFIDDCVPHLNRPYEQRRVWSVKIDPSDNSCSVDKKVSEKAISDLPRYPFSNRIFRDPLVTVSHIDL